MPRTCSFCGGVNPEDCIKLLDAKWEVAPTDKTHKRYIEPPGAYKRYLSSTGRGSRASEVTSEVEVHYSVSPPIKWYSAHWNEAFILKANESIRLLRTGEKG